MLGRILTLFFCLIALPCAAQTACRQALVLGLDVSGSVNQEEYDLQLGGLADALDSADVRDVMLAGLGAPIWVAVFEWSSAAHQSVIHDWVAIDSADRLDALSQRLRGHQKAHRTVQTALGAAAAFGADMLARGPICAKQTMDLSADGKSNDGPQISSVYAAAAFDRITVNALVVVEDQGEDSADLEYLRSDLRAYFEAEVIHGIDAFAEVARGYNDYARAIKRKLLRELAGARLSDAAPLSPLNRPRERVY